MTEGKWLILGIGTILLLGFIIGFAVETFGTEKDLDNTWAEPIADVVGFLIDIFNFTIQGITFIFQSLSNLFGGGVSNEYIEINGTGFSNGESLDGKYYLVNGSGNYLLSDGLFSSTKINTVRSSGTVTEARIDSGKFGLFIKTIYNSTSVNNANENWWESWQKVDNSSNTANLSNSASGERVFVSAPTTAVDEVKNFFSETKNTTKDYVRNIGILPKELGYPMMIILLLMIVYGIIKLLPWT